MVFSRRTTSKDGDAWWNLGKITKVYHDCDTFWYYISVSSSEAFTYSHWGDVSEGEIHFKIEDQRTIDAFEKFLSKDD